MTNIIIYGASGHAKMIVDIIHKKNNYNIVGFIDSFKEPGEKVYGYYVLGNLDKLNTIVKEFEINGVVIGVGDNNNRKLAYKKIKKITPSLTFVSVIHPSAIIANDIVIQLGTVIMAGAIINADSKVGKLCIINSKASLGHDSNLGDFSSLASGVTIGGNVTIGKCSAICIGTTIVNNKTVGNYSVIGASSLVLKNIGDLKIAYGSPIHTIKDRAYSDHYLH